MQRIRTVFAIPMALLSLVGGPLLGDDHDKKTDVTITESVQIPGGTVLAPGTYMFILNNSASNRNIIEIKSEDGKKLYALVIAQRATRVDRTGKTVLTFYEMPAGSPPALRQWFWPGDSDGQEFVYRHDEATKILKASHQTAPEASDQEYLNLQRSSEQPAGAASAK
jgi:hypothetical protein